MSNSFSELLEAMQEPGETQFPETENQKALKEDDRRISDDCLTILEQRVLKDVKHSMEVAKSKGKKGLRIYSLFYFEKVCKILRQEEGVTIRNLEDYTLIRW